MWGFLGGLAGAAGSLFGGMSQQKQANKQFEYGKWAQENEWARQDNQLQRMIKDAKAAGISPLAALGQGNYAAPTQTPSGTAVDPFSNAASSLGSGIASIKGKASKENALLQNDLLRAQIDSVKAGTASTMDQMTRNARTHTVVNSRNVNQDGGNAAIPLMVPYKLPNNRIVMGPNPKIADADQAAFAKLYEEYRNQDPVIDSPGLFSSEPEPPMSKRKLNLPPRLQRSVKSRKAARTGGR